MIDIKSLLGDKDIMRHIMRVQKESVDLSVEDKMKILGSMMGNEITLFESFNPMRTKNVVKQLSMYADLPAEIIYNKMDNIKKLVEPLSSHIKEGMRLQRALSTSVTEFVMNQVGMHEKDLSKVIADIQIYLTRRLPVMKTKLKSYSKPLTWVIVSATVMRLLTDKIKGVGISSDQLIFECKKMIESTVPMFSTEQLQKMREQVKTSTG